MEKERSLSRQIKICIYSIIMIGAALVGFGNEAKAAEVIKLYGKVADYESVLLQWDSDSGTDVFQIERSIGTADEYTILTEISGQTGMVECYDNNVKLGVTYYYKVVQKSGDEIKKESGDISVKVVLPTPSDIKAREIKNSKVKLSWDAVKGAYNYTVYRSTKKKSGFKKIDDVMNNTYIDSAVKKGIVYYYKIVANSKNKKDFASAKSEVVSVRLKPDSPKVEGMYSKKKVKLTWGKITGADVYYIYKKDAKGKYILIGETDKLYYRDSKVKKGKTYEYKVAAVSKVNDKILKGKASNACKVIASAIDPSKKMVALTFDDGPGRYTKDIVKCLKDNQSKATFFVVGCNIDSYKDGLIAADKIGCEIGNHTYSHANLTTLSAQQIQSEIKKTDDKVKKLTGKTTTVMRTPYGATSQNVRDAVGKPIILWSIDTLDWKHRNKDKTYHAVMDHVKDGDIVLMHDIHEPTKEAACSLIVSLRRQGYQLVTVSELAQYRGYQLKKGNVYYSLRRK